ncbi:hypothetical protein [Limisphaera sp. VF-2]|uniref:hypothetical protein n=1 Tax=Limisphaera sp. VF-2 TaxID=3400418 RepID=UPI003C152A38
MSIRILAYMTCLGAAVCGLAVPVSITDIMTPYTQNFDTLANSGTDNTALPPGWAIWEFGINANQEYRAGTGSSNIGDTYSFGDSGSTERALGSLQSGNLWTVFGAQFRNDTDHVITAITISYWGEQWRVGALGRRDQLTFLYSLDATSLLDGIWAFVPELDFVGPDQGGSVGPRNGNDTDHRRFVSYTIEHLEILPGQEWWIQWRDFDANGADDGLAVDDLVMSFQGYRIARGMPDAGGTAGLLALGLLLSAWWPRHARRRS